MGAERFTDRREADMTKPGGKTEQDNKKSAAREDKKAREDKGDKAVDKTVEDSFPASDPPAAY